VSGTAPNRIFNIEWRTVYFTGSGEANFELRLYETTNAFDVIIATLGQGGVGATIGVQDGASRFTQYECNTSAPNGTRIAFTVQPCGTPLPTPSNTPLGNTPTPTQPTGATATSTPTITVTPGGPTETPVPCTITFSDVNPPDYFYVGVMYLACHGVVSGYADGTFRPYNNTTRGQMSKIIVGAVGLTLDCPGTGHFSDVPPTNPFFCYIETGYNHNILSGYADGTFRPFNDVTRGQLSKIVVIAMGWADDCTPPGHFNDVPPGSPFFCYIETAFNHGIITGYDDGTFRPYNPATRGQIAKIVYQALGSPSK
jgi:hypothetical protein